MGSVCLGYECSESILCANFSQVTSSSESQIYPLQNRKVVPTPPQDLIFFHCKIGKVTPAPWIGCEYYMND